MREQKQERNTHAKRPSPTKIATPRRAATRTHPHAVGAHTKRNAGRADQEQHPAYAPHTATTRKRLPHAPSRVTDEWHEEIEEDNAAVAEYLKNLETILNDLDGDAQYTGELWDGANPEGEESYRPLYYSQDDLDTAHNIYQIALDHMTQLLAAN